MPLLDRFRRKKRIEEEPKDEDVVVKYEDEGAEEEEEEGEEPVEFEEVPEEEDVPPLHAPQPSNYTSPPHVISEGGENVQETAKPDEDVERREYLEKEPNYVDYTGRKVIDLQNAEDLRVNDDDVYVIKKKLGRFRETIIDVLEYCPTEEDLEENYADTFGGGTYKIFVGNNRMKLRKVAFVKIEGASHTFSESDAEKIENEALRKWDEMRRFNNEGGYSQSMMNMGNGFPTLPHTTEEMAYWFLNSEKQRLEQEVKHKEELMNQMKGNYEKDIKELQKEKEKLQERVHELELEIIKKTRGGSLVEQIKEFKTTADALGWNVGVGNQNAILQVLNSPVGRQLVAEVDKITDILEKRWEINEWERRIKKIQGKRNVGTQKMPQKIVKNVPQAQVKTQGAQGITKDKLVNKLMQLMQNRVPKDVCELAVDVAMKYGKEKSVKGILRNAVKVILAIEKAQDAATAIDNFVLSGRMTPKEAAEWLVEHEPVYAQQLAQTTYDEILAQVKPFTDNPHIKPLVEYYEQPEVKKAIDEVINELKNIYKQVNALEQEVSLQEEEPKTEPAAPKPEEVKEVSENGK